MSKMLKKEDDYSFKENEEHLDSLYDEIKETKLVKVKCKHCGEMKYVPLIKTIKRLKEKYAENQNMCIHSPSNVDDDLMTNKVSETEDDKNYNRNHQVSFLPIHNESDNPYHDQNENDTHLTQFNHSEEKTTTDDGETDIDNLHQNYANDESVFINETNDCLISNHLENSECKMTDEEHSSVLEEQSTEEQMLLEPSMMATEDTMEDQSMMDTEEPIQYDEPVFFEEPMMTEEQPSMNDTSLVETKEEHSSHTDSSMVSFDQEGKTDSLIINENNDCLIDQLYETFDFKTQMIKARQDEHHFNDHLDLDSIERDRKHQEESKFAYINLSGIMSSVEERRHKHFHHLDQVKNFPYTKNFKRDSAHEFVSSNNYNSFKHIIDNFPCEDDFCGVHHRRLSCNNKRRRGYQPTLNLKQQYFIVESKKQ
ncbi:hypothetical protein [Ureaplasma canigenitalium]|uniref:hypothetical protein n=1 Tax=Ureaplasma canigenitalium TaxID=42092 RepID=UPI0004E1A100|nr:hypothetical protein [Ureaplasma canigenitalium]